MISVCLTSHNGEKYIKKQIDSILIQLDVDDELIISDDGSIDKTLEIISSYNDSRIKLKNYTAPLEYSKIRNSKSFYYVTANFLNALKEAKGDIIFLADQDDIWLDNRIEIMSAKLQTNDCVMCNLSTIDENDKVICENYFTENPVPDNLFNYILKTRILGCCLAFNRKVLDYALPFPKKLIMHDYWIGAIAISNFKFAYISEILHLYRRTDSNVSTTSQKSKNPLYFKILYRIIFSHQLIQHLRKKKKEFKI